MAETAEVKVYDVDKVSNQLTLIEILLNRQEPIKDFVFLDKGLKITYKAKQGVKLVSSQNKGQPYRVLDMIDRAPWNPNNRKATLHIQYLSGEQQFTYFHERFCDIHAPSEVYGYISTRKDFPKPIILKTG